MALGVPARAQSDSARAEILFQEGMRLVEQKRLPEACPKLAESQRLDPALGTEFRLAECYEGLGRFASAWALFVDVGDRSDSQGMVPQRQKARQRADAIEPKLAWLTLVVPPEVAALPGLAILCDDAPIQSASFGVALPLDPGPHRVSAVAPGKLAWASGVTTAAPGERAVLTIPSLADAVVATPLPLVPPPSSPDRARAAAIGLASTAGLGVAVGSVFGALSLARNAAWQAAVADPVNGCSAAPAPACSPAGAARIRIIEQQRGAYATASTAGFVLAGAAAVGAVVSLVVAPRAAVTVGPLGVGVAGAF